jgi:hypothetical protein
VSGQPEKSGAKVATETRRKPEPPRRFRMNRTKALLSSAAPRQHGRTAAAVVFVAMCQTVLQGGAPTRARLRVFRVLSGRRRTRNARTPASRRSLPALCCGCCIGAMHARAACRGCTHMTWRAPASMRRLRSTTTDGGNTTDDGVRTWCNFARAYPVRARAYRVCVRRAAGTREGV